MVEQEQHLVLMEHQLQEQVVEEEEVTYLEVEVLQDLVEQVEVELEVHQEAKQVE